MSDEHKLTPEEWCLANGTFGTFDERGDPVIPEAAVLAELKRLTERTEKAENRERGAVDGIRARLLPELKRLTERAEKAEKERDEWKANAEAAELVAERQRERAKSAERERDAHRAACEKAERDRDDALSGESWARAELESVAAAGWPELARLAEESECLKDQLADVEQRFGDHAFLKGYISPSDATALRERAEKAEKERDEARSINHRALLGIADRVLAEERAKKAERAAAAMRGALEQVRDVIKGRHDSLCVPVWTNYGRHAPNSECDELPGIDAALASDAGRDLLTRDEALKVANIAYQDGEHGSPRSPKKLVDEVIKEREQ